MAQRAQTIVASIARIAWATLQHKFAIFAVALAGASIFGLSAHAATLLRDPDIEHGLDILARPILNAAGLVPDQVDIIVVDNPSFNAFVIDRRAIYLHRGLILKVQNASQLQAVIAHEAAHIANNHFARRMSNAQNAGLIASIGLAIAAAATVGGADPGAAIGLALGTGNAAQRGFFAHTRSEESAADQSGVRYLRSAQVPTKGALEVVELFLGQELLAVSRADPYTLTHPLSQERYRALQAYVRANPGSPASSPEHSYWFERVTTKLSAFTRAPQWTLNQRTGEGEFDLLARAIAFHRVPQAANAQAAIAALVTANPDDPYYLELQGQILLESRAFDAALEAYSSAVALKPANALILGGYGRALLAKDTPEANRRALEVMQQARQRDFRSSAILHSLGLAYARADNPAMASLAAAERFALIGQIDNAIIHAERALQGLAEGSPGHRRASDITRQRQSE